MSNKAHRQKKIADRFRLPPQPNRAMQNYSILRPDYRSVRFLDTEYTVGILRSKREVPRDVKNSKSPDTRQVQERLTYCNSICAEQKLVNTEFYASRKRNIMAMYRMNG